MCGSSVISEEGGIFYYKNRILTNPTSPLTQVLIAKHHDTPIGGHSRYEKTLQRLRKAVYWRAMKGQVRLYVRHCDVCQRYKVENIHPAGLLQPSPMPDQVWEDITMDFMKVYLDVKGKPLY